MKKNLRCCASGLLALSLLVACGCEKRVEEPMPQIRPLDPTTVAQPEAPARCIKPTLPAPKRTAPPSPDPKCPPDPETPPALRAGRVSFPEAKKDEVVLVEITENDHDRQRGLMYRTSMPELHGMIFRMDRREDHSFWMHNTCIPLDMLYLDDDGLIVGIEENTPTMNDDTYSVGCPSRYVLELNAGWTRRHGVAAGQHVKLEGI